MSSHRAHSSATISWRDIPQEVKPTVMSPAGRRRLNRQLIRNVLIGVLAVVLVAGAFEIWRTVSRNPQRFASAAGSRPVEEITLETNGVLDLAWAEQTLALRRDVGLMELDLYAAKERLMATNQVRQAVLTRKFPATLVVQLDERAPVLRLRARQPGGQTGEFLVATDGEVFTGSGFDRDELARLPWLGGVGLTRAGNHFAAIDAIPRVADLLALARENVPDLYASWRVVSLERAAHDRQLIVQSAEIPEIIFSLESDFYGQLARLDLIIERNRARSLRPVQSINLAVDAQQVPVSFRDGPLARQQPPSRPVRSVSAKPSSSSLVTFRLP